MGDGREAKYKFFPDLSGGQCVVHTWHDPVAAIVRVVPLVFTLPHLITQIYDRMFMMLNENILILFRHLSFLELV